LASSIDKRSSGGNFSAGKIIIFSLLPALLLFLLGYLGYGLFRSVRIYHYLKTDQPGWEGAVFRADPALGFAPVPQSQGWQINSGFKTPVRFDSRGFRIPLDADDQTPLKRPLLLALGCSFTFGHGINAEDTFPFLVAKALDGTALNAGLPTYGLAQMVILAQRLIPQYKPDIVLVQFSSWLVDRGDWPFAISYPGVVPIPYFVKSEGKLNITRPAFITRNFDLPLAKYRHTPSRIGDFLSFLKQAGLPLILYDDFQVLFFQARMLFNLVPAPVHEIDRDQVVDAAYRRIERLCRENNAEMVVVFLHDPVTAEPSFAEISRLKALTYPIMVDPGPALLNRLPDHKAGTYYQTYGHLRGSPPQVVDKHPNELANRIIATEILKALGKNFVGPENPPGQRAD